MLESQVERSQQHYSAHEHCCNVLMKERIHISCQYILYMSQI
jgi:hypothetical protein